MIRHISETSFVDIDDLMSDNTVLLNKLDIGNTALDPSVIIMIVPTGEFKDTKVLLKAVTYIDATISEVAEDLKSLAQTEL